MCISKPKLTALRDCSSLMLREFMLCCCSSCVFSFSSNTKKHLQRDCQKRRQRECLVQYYDSRKMCSLKCVFSCHISYVLWSERRPDCPDLCEDGQFVVLSSLLYCPVHCISSSISPVSYNISTHSSFLSLRYCSFVAQEI